MRNSQSLQLLILVVLLSLAAFLHRRKRKLKPSSSFGQSLRLPPSPKGLPLIGHTHLMLGAKYSWKRFHEWSKELDAPVIYLKLGASNVIVINTVKAMNDLLEKRGAIYSSRPTMLVPNDYVSGGRRVVLTPYNERWRKMRRFLHSVLYDKKAATYEPIQEREARALMLNLFTSPSSFADHVQLFSSNLILQIVYGRRAETVNDDCIQDMCRDMETWSKWALPGSQLVQDFPSLDWAPDFLAKWKRDAKKLHQFEVNLYKKLASGVKDKMAQGEQPDCIMRELFEKGKDFALDELDELYLAGQVLSAITLFEAGSDTTTTLILSIILACTADTSICKLAQEELDRVIGPERLPTFADREDLPYITAIVKEVQRWRPATPAGVPHALTEDDEYMGYDHPAGATVIGNMWGIGRDPAVFQDGDVFRPSRYLGEEGKVIDEALNRGHTGFGFGRRVCPGLHVAERSLFLVVALLFWGFDIGPLDNHAAPDLDNFTEGFVSRSRAFQSSISSRSENRAILIKAEGLEAIKFMNDIYS
ncbi:cytochrome P450 [Meredithblackwellia eburnea MCA 4105]